MRSQGSTRKMVRGLTTASVLPFIAILSACGGGGTPAAIPAPPIAPAPPPAPPPAPAPTPTPAVNFNTAEYIRSNGANTHSAITAYDAGATGEGVIVGIIDSGVVATSAEFTGRINPNSFDFGGTLARTDPSDRGITDEGGHGTAVAGIIGANKNDINTQGTAFDASLLILRTDTPGTCADNDPDEDGCTHSNRAITAGIGRAITTGARVINISLGGADGPTPDVRRAIENAAAANIIVVISAGNDSAADPDGFSVGIADAGSGNVIIAGATNANDGIADFSNKAGTGSGAAFYLAAIGSRVRTINEEDRAILFSGTSASAPVISGAAALLVQAFPNLTAAQIVELLFSSATDAGATGDDATFGNGILNIAAAFRPQGQSSVAGSTVLVPQTAFSGTASPAMGDAFQTGAALNTVILDSYQRAFTTDLSASIRSVAPRSILAPALLAQQRGLTAANTKTSIAFTIAQRDDGEIDLHQLLLDGSGAREARVMAGLVATKLSQNTSLSIGFGQSGQFMSARMQGSDQPAFLISTSPTAQSGLSGRPNSAAALRHEMYGFGLSAFVETGKTLTIDNRFFDTTHTQYRGFEYGQLGMTVDRQIGPAQVRFGATWQSEKQTVLGAYFADNFGVGGSSTLFVDTNASFAFGKGWRIGAAWRHGWTQPKTGGLIVNGGSIQTDSFAFDISKRAIFGKADRFAVRVSQPLRISSGALALNLPTSYSYQTLQAGTEIRQLNLAPTGREIASEFSYFAPLFGGTVSSNLYWRQQPGHFQIGTDDMGVALRFSLGF